MRPTLEERHARSEDGSRNYLQLSGQFPFALEGSRPSIAGFNKEIRSIAKIVINRLAILADPGLIVLSPGRNNLPVLIAANAEDKIAGALILKRSVRMGLIRKNGKSESYIRLRSTFFAREKGRLSEHSFRYM